MRTFWTGALALWLGQSISTCQVEPTYWMPVVKSDGKFRYYDYSIRIPDFFVPWVLKANERGGGQRQARTIEGKQYTFVAQGFAWDLSGSAPARTGQIRIDNKKERWTSDDWQVEAQFKKYPAFVKALDAGAQAEGSWRVLDLVALEWPGTAPPGLRYQEPIPILEQKHMLLERLSRNAKAGQYYPEARIPVQHERFRQEMLAIGNLARRDPDYRKQPKIKYARDLSGASAETDQGMEKIYRHNAAPPYFNDLVFNPALNKAAQFQAEYQAVTKEPTHYGPKDYKGAKLETAGDRLKYFGYQFGVEGEGAGGGGGPTDYPEGWMQSDSHFRPWFNVGADVREVGLGVAQAADGSWYFCVVSGLGPQGSKARK